MRTFCEACSPPRIPRYEGRNLVLKSVDCTCKCPETIFESRGPRCPRCDHGVKIEITDRWDDPFLWIDPRTHGPVRLDEAKPAIRSTDLRVLDTANLSEYGES